MINIIDTAHKQKLFGFLLCKSLKQCWDQRTTVLKHAHNFGANLVLGNWSIFLRCACKTWHSSSSQSKKKKYGKVSVQIIMYSKFINRLNWNCPMCIPFSLYVKLLSKIVGYKFQILFLISVNNGTVKNREC